MGDVICAGYWNEVPAPGDTPDLRAIVLMTSTTIEAEGEAAATVAAITALDEFDGVGYARHDLAGVTVTLDATTTPPTVRVDATSDDDAFGATVAAGSDTIHGVLVVRFVDGAGGDIPWLFKLAAAGLNASGGKLGLTIPTGGFILGRMKV